MKLNRKSVDILNKWKENFNLNMNSSDGPHLLDE